MSNQLKPHFEEYWSADLQADYSKARNDAERRRMLLRFGYDKDHKADAVRLFPECFKDGTQDNHSYEKPVSNDVNQTKRNKFDKIKDIVKVVVAVMSGVTVVVQFVRWIIALFSWFFGIVL